MQLASNTNSILAILADAYIPILLILALFYVVQSWMAGNRLHLAQFVYALVIVYVLMFVDWYFHWWAALGLDYSTHSAAAFALIVVIGMGKSLPYKMILTASLVAYAGLMDLLNYHNWGDMLTTVLVLGISLLPVLRSHVSAKASLSNI